MANRRTMLQEILENFIGTPNVYFQPPETFKLKYPCVIYEVDNTLTRFANNDLYYDKDRYQMTVIDKNPDSEFFQKAKGLRYCRFIRHYVANNLHHWVFNIYF